MLSQGCKMELLASFRNNIELEDFVRLRGCLGESLARLLHAEPVDTRNSKQSIRRDKAKKEAWPCVFVLRR